jgi:hypothetical protein
MIIARDVKLSQEPQASGTTRQVQKHFLHVLHTTFFLRSNKKPEKNNDKQQFSPVRRV